MPSPSPMRVAIVTPYFRESLDVLKACHQSVRSQTHPCTHFLVADGHPRKEIAKWAVEHLPLPKSHDDLGNTPRCLGAISAMNQGFDAIAFLDADNWFESGHVETMIELHRQTGADVCTASRNFHRLDGSLMYADRHESDGKNHVDTNCLFLARPAFRVLPVWAMMPRELCIYCDRIFWQAILARGFSTAHHPHPTVAYRTPHQVHYRNINETPPAGAKTNEAFEAALGWWRALPVDSRRDWSTFLMGGPGRTMKLGAEIVPALTAAQENNRGVQLLSAGKYAEAEAAFRRAYRRAPSLPEISFNIGKALQGQNRLREAEEHFLAAIRGRPDWVDAHVQLGFLYFSLRRLTDAEAAYRKAIEIRPGDVDALNSLGANVLNNEGRAEEARDVYRQALAIAPDHANCHSNLLLNEQYAEGATAAGLAVLHAEWDKRHAARFSTTGEPGEPGPGSGRPLRLGFVSGDFFYHPVGVFLAPVLERLNRQKWVTVCYANQKKADELTRRLTRAAQHWHDVADMSDEALAQKIRGDEIDLLIDLSGHTGRNRLLTFARRPAPVQLTWMGYVGTTGLRAMDYLIADRFHVPPGAEAHYCEKILRLPDGYLAYQPPPYAAPVGPLPALANGYVTFGSFNNTAKISLAVVELWAEILKRVPRSRLMMKYHWLGDEGLRKRYACLFASHGIEADRLEFLGESTHVHQLGEYNRMDLALDSFPYSGGLTTCEACWMGVPVITCPGETFASRHSLSHLSNMGVTETIAGGRADMIELAVRWANDLPGLTALRAGLRERMAGSPLCDIERFTRGFEEALAGVADVGRRGVS